MGGGASMASPDDSPGAGQDNDVFELLQAATARDEDAPAEDIAARADALEEDSLDVDDIGSDEVTSLAAPEDEPVEEEEAPEEPAATEVPADDSGADAEAAEFAEEETEAALEEESNDAAIDESTEDLSSISSTDEDPTFQILQDPGPGETVIEINVGGARNSNAISAGGQGMRFLAFGGTRAGVPSPYSDTPDYQCETDASGVCRMVVQNRTGGSGNGTEGYWISPDPNQPAGLNWEPIP